ncbi:MAG: exodeoxyribonuclease III [Planctomycetaceae bacterium]|jgi:exodeoxyribonuclease-3|nr:exodeoxyribonuclease III [Planctomycetaceae bacterium]
MSKVSENDNRRSRLISWNVNGLRACLTKGFLDSVGGLCADVICLQETKMQQGQAEIDIHGYTQYWNSATKKGYSGTAIFTRLEVLSASYGIGVDEHDQEGRVITLEFEEFILVNVYTPNARQDLVRLDYRMEWEDAFRVYLSGLDRVKPLIICGDLNVARNEIDLYHPDSNRGNPGFTDEERNKITELLDAGFVDTFRAIYPNDANKYTWWSFRSNARNNNVGWRIDYFIVSQRLFPQVVDALIYPNIYGSDHCPVGLEINSNNQLPKK